ncbi:uncharacterized protein LOC116179567 [Photinus pyralis]|uniref:uncharacterized protein LOC116179567 n=1 Tax=Photinus pyralis TaxID=7054 RepID=UPI0012676AB0|nr:uncharacterized protein LOC116179567 [Photinus pyralis]
MDREKFQIPSLLCTADQNGAVHGIKPCENSASSKTALCSELDNTDKLENEHDWVSETSFLGGSKSGESGKCVHHETCYCNETFLINHLGENGVVFNNNNTLSLLDELLDATQVNGPWLVEHPLPLPIWATDPKQILKFESVWHYEKFVSQLEVHIQQVLERHNYNTIGNFMALYQSFKGSGCYNLRDYLHMYSPPITSLHHTCVGLALELWTKLVELNEKYPSLSNYLYLASCEENIETVDDYVQLGDGLEAVSTSLEKEHVLLALRFEIAGRYGVLLCDPGYHISRAITVMQDQLYPHTGQFVQSREAHARKEYNYTFSANSTFVQWSETVTNANGVKAYDTALVYISRPYLTAVDVTERRNLVYNFRSLLSRDSKGGLKAGIYFKLKENHDEFTIFYQNGGVKKRLKYNFGSFAYPIEETTKKVVRECSLQLNLAEDALECILISLAQVLSDQSYIKQLLEINCEINNLAEDN